MSKANEFIKEFLIANKNLLSNSDLICQDLINLKDKYYSTVKKEPRITEWLIFACLSYQLGANIIDGQTPFKTDKFVLYPEKRYKGKIGNQNLDIVLMEKDEIRLGISIKVQGTTPAYLDGADFRNPVLINQYRSSINATDHELHHAIQNKKDKIRIKVPTLLQDIARIENLQVDPVNRFQSATIIYDCMTKKEEEWVTNLSDQFNHKYLFLADNPDLSIKDWFTMNFEELRTLSS